jgi:putative salt-induced outer membrane protein
MGEAGSAAAASAALKEAGDGWNWVGVLGASYLSGNSETTLITSGIQALKTDNDRESGLGFSIGYSEVTSVTTANRYDAYAFHNRDLNQRWHFGARANYQNHQIAGLDYRIDFGPHIGYRLVDTEETELRIEGGLSYTLEDQIVRGEFVSLRFGQFLTHKLTDRTDLVQSMEYLSAVDDFSNWNGSASLGIVSAMTDRIKWSNEIVYDFDNVPATGFQKADLSIVSGIKWSF